jgi:hypothetical protein
MKPAWTRQPAVKMAIGGDPVVITLAARARDGDQHAWNEIVDRYAPLVWSVCKRYELSRHDTDDIGQTVRLLLDSDLQASVAGSAPRKDTGGVPSA